MLSKEQWNEVLIERHTKEVHDKISSASVIIAGLGGLGSNIAVALTKAGIGHLCLVDFDVVEPSNLNRQAYTMSSLGLYKTEALKKILLSINPYLKITTCCTKVTEENIPSIFKNFNIICEAFDKADNKAMLVNYILEHYPDKKLVSASGMAGYKSSNTIKTRKVMKNFYLCGDETSGIESGLSLMAPRVGICANHQANMILRLILGIEDV